MKIQALQLWTRKRDSCAPPLHLGARIDSPTAPAAPLASRQRGASFHIAHTRCLWRLHFTISDASHLQCHSRSLLLVPAQVDGTITIFCQRGRARRLAGDALTAEQQLHLQDHEQRQVPAENCPLKLLPSNCLCSQYAGQLQSVRRARPGRFTELVAAGLLLTG